MLRLIALAFAAPLLMLALVACGGDDDDAPDGTATSDTSSGDGTPAGTLTPGGTPTETPETPISTPTRVADTDPLMVVNYGATLLQPTAAEVAALPQSDIEGLDGESYTGVTLIDLAAAVGAPADGFVELQGIRSDGIRLTTVRYSMAESGADTVVFVAESGNVSVVSGSVPEANWLSAIQAIAYL